MPVFKIEMFKRLGSENWANVYHVEAATLLSATDAVPIIRNMEVGMHLDTVTIEYARVSTLAEGDGIYTTIPINSAGGRSSAGGTLPLFNTLRADFPPDGGGRPSRKYFRGALTEGDISFDTISGVRLADAQTVLDNLIDNLQTAGLPYVDVDGQTIQVASPYTRVQMRQLHRRRRRVSSPS